MTRQTSLLSFVSLKASLVMHETKNYNLLLNTDIYIYMGCTFVHMAFLALTPNFFTTL